MIKGYSAIVDFNSSKDAGEAAGEAALQVVGTLHEIDLFVCFQVDQNMMIPSLSAAFAAVHLWTLIKKKKRQRKVHFVFPVSLTADVYFHFNILSLSVSFKD